MGAQGPSWEGEQLDRRPELRRQITESADFRRWLSDLPRIEIDGETLYLPWGDAPMDGDQVAYVWARQEGLLES